jgi:hypothetical protein
LGSGEEGLAGIVEEGLALLSAGDWGMVPMPSGCGATSVTSDAGASLA